MKVHHRAPKEEEQVEQVLQSNAKRASQASVNELAILLTPSLSINPGTLPLMGSGHAEQPPVIEAFKGCLLLQNTHVPIFHCD